MIKKMILFGLILGCAPLASAQWVTQSTHLPQNFVIYFISPVDEQVVWAAGLWMHGEITAGWFCRTVDGGENWEAGQVPIPTNHRILNICAISAETAWVGVLGGGTTIEGVYKTSDGGKNWIQQKNGMPNPGTVLDFVHFFDARDGLAVYDQIDGYCPIFTSSDGGSTWERVDDAHNIPMLPGENPSENSYCTAGDVIFWGASGGSSGRVFKSLDRGKSWQVIRSDFTSPPSITVYPAFKDSLHGMLAAFATTNADPQGMAITSDGGATWSRISPPAGAFYCVDLPGTPGGYLVRCGDVFGAGSVSFTLDSGSTWTVITDVGYFSPTFVSWKTGWAGIPSQSEIRKWQIGPEPAIGIYPTRMAFAPTSTGQSSQPQILSITNYGQEPLKISEIISPGANFRLGVSPSLPVTLAALETARLEVSCTPTAGTSVLDSLILISNADRTPRAAIRLEGEGVKIEKAAAETLYAVTAASLYTLDPATAKGVVLAKMDMTRTQNLIINPHSQELIAVNTMAGRTELYCLCAATGRTVLMRTIPVGSMRCFAFKADTLLGASMTGELYRIDLASGAATLIGAAPDVKYYGLAVHPVTGVIYASVISAAGADKDLIVTVNPDNGDTTRVGPTGDGQVTVALTFSPSGTLYGLKGSAITSLVRIDPVTGAGTTVGPIGVPSLVGIAWAANFTAVPPRAGNGTVPGRFALGQNFPNPFNSATVIGFSVPHAAHVVIAIYDLLGRKICMPIDGDYSAGLHRTTISAEALPSGLYFYMMTAGKFSALRKFVVVR